MCDLTGAERDDDQLTPAGMGNKQRDGLAIGHDSAAEHRGVRGEHCHEARWQRELCAARGDEPAARERQCDLDIAELGRGELTEVIDQRKTRVRRPDRRGRTAGCGLEHRASGERQRVGRAEGSPGVIDARELVIVGRDPQLIGERSDGTSIADREPRRLTAGTQFDDRDRVWLHSDQRLAGVIKDQGAPQQRCWRERHWRIGILVRGSQLRTIHSLWIATGTVVIPTSFLSLW